MAKVGRISIFVACLLASAQAFAAGQVVERNINMVAGQVWPFGDPFLRQQNEPSIAVSTMNPLTLMAATNDYRTVDIAFPVPPRPDDEQTGDAWIGIFKSFDGGNRWISTLLEGYPQQQNTNSPLKGFQAAADPVVRAGNHGMFYVSGIVTNRGANPLGGVFVARFIDNNNREYGDRIAYLDTKMIANGTTGQFIDKPWFAVDPKPNGLQCTVNGVSFPAQNLYLAYTIFVGGDNNIRTKMMFARSQNCGATWQPGTKLSETFPVNQGAVIAVDPSANNVYVAWRQFASGSSPNAIILAKSTDGGATFPKANVIANIIPFEQGTGNFNIRTNAYPAMAVDNAGRIYVAWSQRIAQTPTPFDPEPSDGRIVMISSADGGVSWTPLPAHIDAAQINDISPNRGHQFMPSLNFSAGKLAAVWYDLRQDHTIGTYTANPDGSYTEVRTPVGNLAQGQPDVVFWNFMADYSPIAGVAYKLVRRHTLDVYAAEASTSVMPLAFTTQRVSRYKFGSWKDSDGNPVAIQDLQINPPNLPMFAGGTVPFIGDYIDLAAYLPQTASENSVASRIRHVVWTDDRDVRPPFSVPPNAPDWKKYTPVHSESLGNMSLFDPTKQTTPCVDPVNDATGSRNQNIYTSRISDGMFAGSPGNAKQLNISRAFSVFVQNARDTLAFYRLSVAVVAPSAGTVSFTQTGAPVSSTDVSIPPHSTATRTVFVSNASLHAKIEVKVIEFDSAFVSQVQGGLSSTVSLNPDPQNPDIGNPDIGNPDIGNQEVFNPDIGNPDIGNPDIGNPDIGNPDIGNPDIGNPDIGNPDIGNPDIGNPDIGNPDIGNPDIGNPDIGNGSVTDTTWDAENTGNTTGGYTVKLFQSSPLPPNITKSQLILHKVYDTPIARDCNLGVEHHRQIVASINNPDFTTIISDVSDPSLTDPSEKNATLWLAPHEKGYITVRLIDPVNQGLTLDASSYVTPVVVAQAVNTTDAANGGTTPSVSLTMTPTRLPDAIRSREFYNQTLLAIGGVGDKTFSGGAGLPGGITLNSQGQVSGGIIAPAGSYPFSATVTDSKTPTPDIKISTIQFRIVDNLFIEQQSLPNAITGRPYSAPIAYRGGVGPFSWSLDPQSLPLPPGLSLSTQGVITGTATEAGEYSFTVHVEDSTFPQPQSSTQALNIIVVQGLTVNGTFVYDGVPRTPSATPNFFLRNESTGQGEDAPIAWHGDTTFTISGLLPGTYGVEGTSDENPTNPINYPGDFYGWQTFDATVASDGGLNLPLTRVIHVTSPFNNGVQFPYTYSCPPGLTAAAPPSQFTWDPIDIAGVTYNWRVVLTGCGAPEGGTIASGSTTGTSATFDPLPATPPQSYYSFVITAISPSQNFVGQIMTNGIAWWNWEVQFVVP